MAMPAKGGMVLAAKYPSAPAARRQEMEAGQERRFFDNGRRKIRKKYPCRAVYQNSVQISWLSCQSQTITVLKYGKSSGVRLFTIPVLSIPGNSAFVRRQGLCIGDPSSHLAVYQSIAAASNCYQRKKAAGTFPAQKAVGRCAALFPTLYKSLQ